MQKKNAGFYKETSGFTLDCLNNFVLKNLFLPPAPPAIQPPDTSTVPVGSVALGATSFDCASCGDAAFGPNQRTASRTLERPQRRMPRRSWTHMARGRHDAHDISPLNTGSRG